MRQLLLLRHAKSAWDNPGLNDHDRTLNKRGLADAPTIGRLLTQHNIVPDLTLTSSATRAQQTTQLVAEAADIPDDAIQTLPHLYHATPHELIYAAHQATETTNRLLIVAHNPGLEELTSHLAGQYHRFPTAALAVFNLELEDWGELNPDTTAQLLHIFRPKEL